MKLTTISTNFILNQRDVLTDGHYNIQNHGESFRYEDKVYTYHSSGLARVVYRSDCGKFVIKVPIGSTFHDMDSFEEHSKNNFRWAAPSINHNIGEAKAYEDCPEEYRTYLAKSELLPNCWVRQEFVEVLECRFTGRHDLREIGRRADGSFCIFDYDPLLEDFRWTGYCNWERLAKVVVEIRLKIMGII